MQARAAPVTTRVSAAYLPPHRGTPHRSPPRVAAQELEGALKLEPDSDKIKALLRDAQLTWEADFD